MSYKLMRDPTTSVVVGVRHPSGFAVPADEGNADYQEYLRWVQDGNAAQAADPLPEPEPSRDERLLAAVAAAKTAVTASKSFTAEQAAVLSAVFDGLGKAITGESV